MKQRTQNVVTVLAIAAAVVSAPSAVLASHAFTDVPDDSVYASAVERLMAAGVIKGCTDSAFCPQDTATRGQLALLLDRLSGNGDVGPSVNAATLMGMTPEQLRGQTGLAGPDGPAGPAGAKGDIGAAGPAGPAGAKGDAGAPGATGDTGAAGTNGTNGTNGISRAYTARNDVAAADSVGLVLTLPAGSAYVINAKTILRSSSTNGAFAACFLRLDGSNIDASEAAIGSSSRVTVTSQATTPVLGVQSSLELICNTFGATFDKTVVTAVAVNAINPP